MKSRLALALAAIILAAPAAAIAQTPRPGGSEAHMRPALFHDRAPRPHVHTIAPHH